MKVWEIVGDDGIDALNFAERPSPAPGPGQVKIRLRANSINRRDLNTIRAPSQRGIEFPRVPNSDSAGDVIDVGAGVETVAVGDRVAGCFFQDWTDGPVSVGRMATTLGGPIDGVLAEEVVLNERGVVPIPDHLDYEQAATLPCAALTAWHALIVKGGLKAGDTVLILGTGGVSIFALQFCAMMGARAIVTSKSDQKLDHARSLGAWRTVNYVAAPGWADEVRSMTGDGVDHVVEVGGAGTLGKSIEAVRHAGHIAMIGVLTSGSVNPALLALKSIRLSGIYVGSQAMFQDMNAAIAANELAPVIDRAFNFDEAPAAYRYMAEDGHFGKITIRMPGS